jgi:glycosyltransferase involved in cell wall biosynthesis
VVEDADFGGETALLRSAKVEARIGVKLHTPMKVKDAVLGKRAVARGRVVYAIERRAILGADFLTTPSRASAERARAVFGKPSLEAQVVRNPLDVDHWKPASESLRRRTLLFVGRLETYKGPDRLPPVLNSVLRRRPEVTARFVGGAATPRVTDSLVAALDPEVRARVWFEDQVERSKLLAEYQSAATCLIPSRFEAFCYVCAEAMACGLPVIASRGTAMDELVTHGESGYLVDYDNAEAVAILIEEMLSNDERARRVGREARERIAALCAPERVAADWEAAVRAGRVCSPAGGPSEIMSSWAEQGPT